MSDLTPAVSFELILSQAMPVELPQAQTCSPIFLWEYQRPEPGNRRVLVQKLLDLSRIDILATRIIMSLMRPTIRTWPPRPWLPNHPNEASLPHRWFRQCARDRSSSPASPNNPVQISPFSPLRRRPLIDVDFGPGHGAPHRLGSRARAVVVSVLLIGLSSVWP